MPGPSDQDCVVVLETAATSGAKSKKPYAAAAAASGDFTASSGAGPSSIIAKQVQLNRSLDLTSSANPRQQNLLHQSPSRL